MTVRFRDPDDVTIRLCNGVCGPVLAGEIGEG
jgi:hypothetical protein